MASRGTKKIHDCLGLSLCCHQIMFRSQEYCVLGYLTHKNNMISIISSGYLLVVVLSFLFYFSLCSFTPPLLLFLFIQEILMELNGPTKFFFSVVAILINATRFDTKWKNLRVVAFNPVWNSYSFTLQSSVSCARLLFLTNRNKQNKTE